MNFGFAESDVPSPEALLEDDERLLLRLERLTAQLADRIERRHGEDDRSVWDRAGARVFDSASPDAPN
jgi:hypothetical protein